MTDQGGRTNLGLRFLKTKSQLNRLLPNGRGLWVPMDHGLSNYPEPGLDGSTMHEVIDAVIQGGANAVILQKGVLSHQRFHHPNHQDFENYIVHLSASTVHNIDDYKVLVGSAYEAYDRGAVAVSGQVNLGTDYESMMLNDLGRLTEEAWDIGIPVLGMIYPRGKNLRINPDDPTKGVAHAVRIAYEIGCNVAKVPWTGSVESFRIVTSAAPIPVLIAGGESGPTMEDTLTMVRASLEAGGAGTCMGRRIFSSDQPKNTTQALRAIIDGSSVDEALSFL